MEVLKQLAGKDNTTEEDSEPTKTGVEPIPVADHKYKKKRPIYDSDLKKKQQELALAQLSPFEQILGILAGIAFAYGTHQLAKYILSFFAKKCCALPEIPTEVPLPTA